jgi:hypothetical protein
MSSELVSNQELSKTCEVVIDCAAFQPRPDTILISILEGISNEAKLHSGPSASGTQLSIDDFVKESSFYGSWTFIPLKEKENLYLENQKLIGEKLKKYFNAGQIRAAEW